MADINHPPGADPQYEPLVEHLRGAVGAADEHDQGVIDPGQPMALQLQAIAAMQGLVELLLQFTIVAEAYLPADPDGPVPAVSTFTFNNRAARHAETS